MWGDDGSGVIQRENVLKTNWEQQAMRKSCRSQGQRWWHSSDSEARIHESRRTSGTASRLSLFLLMFVSLLSAGCGGDTLETVTVSGTVTIDGTPLDNGVVRFVPTDTDKGRLATGAIKEGGKFELATAGSTGVLEGDYKVTVESMKITPDVPQKDRELGIGGKESAIPKKYNSAETSGLTEKVDGAKTITLDLKSK